MIISKNKAALVIIMFTISMCNLHAQNYSIKDRLGINVLLSTRIAEIDYFSEFSDRNYGLALNYGILDYLEIGPYYKFKRDWKGIPQGDCSTNEIAEYGYGDCSFYMVKYTVSYYGIQANLHVLPFLIKSEFFRFDLYLTGKFGGVHYDYPEDSNQPNWNLADLNYGAGLAYYIGKYFGVYAEYTHGKDWQWGGDWSPYTFRHLEIGVRRNFQLKLSR